MGKTVIIGLDGATFTLLDALMEQGVMPRLKEFAASGVRADLMSTANPLTPPAWISMVTGRTPGHHGVFDFLRPEEHGNGLALKLNDSRDIRCETLWSIAGRQGRRVASLNFYGMNPAFPVSGYLVSGFVPWKHLRRATYPPAFYDTVRSLPGVNVRELGFHLDQEKKCFQGDSMSHAEARAWIESHLARERNWFAILAHIMENDPCDLVAVVFDGVDKIQHLFWRLLDPSLPAGSLSAQDRELRDLCLRYYRQLDGIVGRIGEMAGEDARTFIVSDHGFGTTNEIFYLNKWLADRGYLEWADPDKVAVGTQLTEDRISSHMGLLNQRKTVAYAWTPSSNGLFIKVSRGPGQPGVSPDEYGEVRERIRRELLDFRDAEGRPVIRRVMTREEAFPGPLCGLAPDLTLVPRDHGMISILNADAPRRGRPEPAGTHNPAGIFIARGPGIRRGGSCAPLSIVDVAPAVLHSLSLPVPEDFEGALPTEVFTGEFLRDHPASVSGRTVSAAEPGAPEGSAGADDDNDAVMSELRALGYIE